MRIESGPVDYSVLQNYSERRERIEQLRAELREAPPRVSAASRGAPEALPQDGSIDDPRLLLAKLVVETLLGGRSAGFKPGGGVDGISAHVSAGRGGPQWRVVVSHREVYEETENLVVRARGVVRTADGVEIEFNAEFRLARSFRAETGWIVGAGNPALTDPLFLEVAGRQALLVRDADANGTVSGDDELFGARTGDGFNELGLLDDDGNGWIDSGDAAFGQLRLRLGDGSLQSLEALGIGALSTSGAAGEFHYKNESNELVAVVRRTGVYLTEDGRAGALRQIDLAT
ncbi:MAG: hypothetical protein KIT09_11050 [Bryobacteraceae bacterium]|nr:hypothetical protein [Bryobacteraceae bacterium]